MLKFNYFILFSIFTLSTSVVAQNDIKDSEGFIKIKNVLDSQIVSEDIDNIAVDDIGYFKVIPQVKENQTVEESIEVEFFIGEFDGTERSQLRLNTVKEMIDDDRKKQDPQTLSENSEVWAVSARGLDSHYSGENKKIIDSLGFQKSEKKFEQVPEHVFFSANQDRTPQSISFGVKRILWIVTKFTAATGASYYALTVTQGLSPIIALSIGVWPGIASTALTVFNGKFGRFLTNGSWAKWLLESNNLFAKSIRFSMGMTPVNFEKQLVKNKKFLQRTRPDLYKTPEVFERKLQEVTKIQVNKKASKIAKMAKFMGASDEYVKWYITEVAFTSGAIKLPESINTYGIANIGFVAADSFNPEILAHSTMGFAAQGPADLAVQNKKNIKLKELQELVKKDTIKIKSIKDAKKYARMGLMTNYQKKNLNKLVKDGFFEVHRAKALRSELKAFFNKEVRKAIGKTSHPALRRIELWTISRATTISITSMAGIIMKVAQVPVIPDIILLSVGSTGALYYANVKGWLTKEKIKYVFSKRFLNDMKKTNLFSAKGLIHRFCAGKFTSKNIEWLNFGKM